MGDGGRSKSDLILDELKKRKAQNRVVDVDEKKMKTVIFSLLGEFFALPGANVKEILPLAPIYPVPGAPAHIPGVINIRGEIESVVTINSFLGLAESDRSPSSRIAIVESGAIRSGILIDSIADVLDIPESIVKPRLDTLSKSHKEFVAGEFMYHQKNIILLDVAKILGKIAA